MSDRELSNKLLSGEINAIFLGGTASSDKAVKIEDLDVVVDSVVALSDRVDATDAEVAIAEAELAEATAYKNGFDLRDHTYHGIMELCPNAVAGLYWRLDEDNVFTTITGATTFGDGVTPLADRTFVHRPTGTNPIRFYSRGAIIEKTTTQVLALDNVATKQIVAYDWDTGLLHLATGIYDAIEEDTICAVVSGNPTLQQKVIFANERHGAEMSTATHRMLHSTDGAKYGFGLAINGLANNGNTFTSISSGEIWDEDLQHIVGAVTDAPFIYRDTQGNWAMEMRGGSVYSTNELAFTNDTGDDSLYNRDNGDGSWSLVDTGQDFVVNHIFATNDGEYPIFKIVGQELYLDRDTAREHAAGEMAKFQEGDLPSPEFLHLYSYILDGNGNIETGLNGEIYLDFKQGYQIGRY